MKKFFVLFAIPVATMDEWRKSNSMEQMKKASGEMRDAWMKWMDAHGSALSDKGTPLGKTKRVSAKGVVDVRNDFNWHAVVEAESQQAAADLFKDHPHLQIPDAYIEIMEMTPPQGM